MDENTQLDGGGGWGEGGGGHVLLATEQQQQSKQVESLKSLLASRSTLYATKCTL